MHYTYVYIVCTTYDDRTLHRLVSYMKNIGGIDEKKKKIQKSDRERKKYPIDYHYIRTLLFLYRQQLIFFIFNTRRDDVRIYEYITSVECRLHAHLPRMRNDNMRLTRLMNVFDNIFFITGYHVFLLLIFFCAALLIKRLSRSLSGNNVQIN